MISELTDYRQNSRDSNLWFTISACTLGKEAVEGRDGYTVMVLPNEQEKTSHVTTCICWEMMGASVVEP
jgi:ribonuclease P/MRP protein subunit RPP40